MFLSQFKAPAQQRVTVSKFGGYDARRRAPLGSFARMENLTGDGYPTLSVREKRKTIAALDKPNGLAAKDSLIWVDGRTLYINGLAIDLALTDGEKQLVSMGAYLLIWPDKKYVNTQNLSDRGSLENAIQTTGAVTYALCRADGTEYEGYTTGAAAPASAESGDLWLDTGSGAALMRYDGVMWQAVDDARVEAQLRRHRNGLLRGGRRDPLRLHRRCGGRHMDAAAMQRQCHRHRHGGRH